MINRLWRVIHGLWNSIFQSSHERVLRRYQRELDEWDRLAAGGAIIRGELKSASVPRYRWVKIGVLPTWKLLDCESDRYIGQFYKSNRDVYRCGSEEYRTKQRAASALLENKKISTRHVGPLG